MAALGPGEVTPVDGAVADAAPALSRSGRFARALVGPHVAVIAEIKRRSPSKGSIADGLHAPERAAAYERGGAAALSVLTEPTRFGGSLGDLRDVRAAVGLPLLRKDFITHRVQLLEARVAGASAALLIARALSPDALAELAADAAQIGLEVLVEVRNEAELERAVAVAGAVIGVNNRNLETLEIEPSVTERLLPMVPPDRAAVYESGVHGIADVERAAGLGADAVLVGSVLSASSDGVSAVQALTSVPRQPRG